MFITNKSLSRRTVLKGMGVTMALPLLEAMVPARTMFAQGAAAGKKLRFVAIEMVHGAAGSAPIGAQKHLWSPAATGNAFDLSPSSLSPLEPFRDYLTIVSNTDVRNAEAIDGLRPVKGPDGMRAVGNMLLHAENGAGKVDSLTITGDTAHVTVLKDGLNQPTGVEPAGNTIWIANRGAGQQRPVDPGRRRQ